mgnify:CR=1 FL=1
MPNIQTLEEQQAYDAVLQKYRGNEAAADAEWRWAEEVVRCKREFWYFCWQYLGYHQMLPDHRGLCDWMQTHATQPKLILMPRYSFKSSIGTVGYALWCLLRNPNERILIYSDTTEKAQGFLLEIKNHILGLTNEGLFRLLTNETPWDVDPQQQMWNQSAIVIKARRQAQREPSVDTAGIETSKVGMHYDRILFDDMVSDKNVTTPEQMAKVWECYTKSLSLLKPGGDLVMLGTRWHFGDAYGRILADNERTGAWATYVRAAEEAGRFPFADIGLTESFLQQKRREQGSYLYSVLYQNSPVDDETALFRLTDFTFYPPPTGPERRKRFVEPLFVSCCLDPATGKAGAEDRAALSVVGTDNELNMYLLDLVAGQMTPAEQVEEVFSLYHHWRFSVLGIETNAFQEMLKRDVDFRYAEERRRNPTFRLFSIQSFTASSVNTKEMRIRALQPYHERGALRFPGERLETLPEPWRTLTHQMTQYTPSHKPVHEDELDSLAYHVLIHRPGRLTKPAETIPRLSPAWFERYQYDQELAEYRERPRWARGRAPDHALAFS